MTPQEKALDLVDKFRIISYGKHSLPTKNKAKQCALIAVNEVISSNPHSNPLNTNVESTTDFWQEVKQEIEKL